MGKLSAGELDRKIRIESVVITKSSSGEPIRAWALFAYAWAKVLPVYASERLAADQQLAFKTSRFTIRFLENITESMRILFDGVAYNITGIAEIGFREGLQLTGEVAD